MKKTICTALCVCFVVVSDFRPSAGGESCDATLPCDGGQPIDAAAVLDRSFLLCADVHRLQRAAGRPVPQVYASQTSIPLG